MSIRGAGFTDDFITRWLPAFGLWQIEKMFEFHSGSAGTGLFIRCEKGMKTDLASIPWAVRWLIPRVGRDAQGAAVHDQGYRDGTMLVRKDGEELSVPVNRAMVDGMYYQAMLALGVRPWRREMIYRGLQVGGWVAWNRYRKKGTGTTTDTTR